MLLLLGHFVFGLKSDTVHHNSIDFTESFATNVQGFCL